MAGAFVWDWVDQSRYKSLSDFFAGWNFKEAQHNLTGTAEGERKDLQTGLDGQQNPQRRRSLQRLPSDRPERLRSMKPSAARTVRSRSKST